MRYYLWMSIGYRWIIVLLIVSHAPALAARGTPLPRPATTSTVPASDVVCYKGFQVLGPTTAQIARRAPAGRPAAIAALRSPGGPLLRPHPARPRIVIRSLAALEQLRDIEAVRYIPETGELLVIGPAVTPGEEGLRVDDWLVVFRALAHGGLGLSIDPGPTPDQMVVRYIPDGIRGINSTYLGRKVQKLERANS